MIAIINTFSFILIAPYAPSGIAIGSLFVPFLSLSIFLGGGFLELQTFFQSDTCRIFLISSMWGIGTIIGSYASATTSGRFKIRRLRKSSSIRSFSGGLLMGVGIMLMSGCNVFHVYGGLSLFVPTSIIVTFGIIASAYLALKFYQMILRQNKISKSDRLS